MGYCVTVRGEKDSRTIGVCHSHEHILLRKGQSWKVNEVLWQDEPEKSRRELERFYASGGRTIVDAQPVGCGRMALKLREISEGSNVDIIASTGFHKLLFYPEDHWIRSKSSEELEELFVSELLTGMYDDGDWQEPQIRTDVRAGQIKTALDTEGLTARYRRLFKACAAASVRTGAPVMIHVEQGSDPLELLDFLKGEGLPGHRMIFCHLDRACRDLKVHEEIAGSGAWLEYDTIGRPKYHSDRREAEIIRYMWEKGWGDHLLLSLDTTRKRLGAYGGEISLNYIMEQFLPLLRSGGISEEQIEQMMVRSPGRAFEIDYSSLHFGLSTITGFPSLSKMSL